MSPEHIQCEQTIGALKARLQRSEEQHAEELRTIRVLQGEVNRWRAAYPDMPIQATSTGVTT